MAEGKSKGGGRKGSRSLARSAAQKASGLKQRRALRRESLDFVALNGAAEEDSDGSGGESSLRVVSTHHPSDDESSSSSSLDFSDGCLDEPQRTQETASPGESDESENDFDEISPKSYSQDKPRDDAETPASQKEKENAVSEGAGRDLLLDDETSWADLHLSRPLLKVRWTPQPRRGILRSEIRKTLGFFVHSSHPPLPSGMAISARRRCTNSGLLGRR